MTRLFAHSPAYLAPTSLYVNVTARPEWTVRGIANMFSLFFRAYLHPRWLDGALSGFKLVILKLLPYTYLTFPTRLGFLKHNRDDLHAIKDLFAEGAPVLWLHESLIHKPNAKTCAFRQNKTANRQCVRV